MRLPLLPGFLPFDSRASFLLTPALLQPLALVASPKLGLLHPPSLFDCQVHLLVHLVDEIAIVGPVHCRWMYWLERYMAVLKGYVRNHARVEGSMAA
jgi:hypothetical protein